MVYPGTYLCHARAVALREGHHQAQVLIASHHRSRPVRSRRGREEEGAADVDATSEAARLLATGDERGSVSRIIGDEEEYKRFCDLLNISTSPRHLRATWESSGSPVDEAIRVSVKMEAVAAEADHVRRRVNDFFLIPRERNFRDLEATNN